MMSEVPEEIRQQIHEASVDEEVQVCFSRSLIHDLNVDQIDVFSLFKNKFLEFGCCQVKNFIVDTSGSTSEIWGVTPKY